MTTYLERHQEQRAAMSVPALIETAELLERGARRQMLDVVDLLEARLQQLISIYQSAADGVPRLQIEREIAQAIALIRDVRPMAVVALSSR